MFENKPLKTLFSLIFFLLFVTSCDNNDIDEYKPIFSNESANAKQVYLFGIHPLHNPKRLHTVFDPIMQYLSNKIEGIEFQVEASRNYASYDAKLYSGKFHFSLPNPFQTVNSFEHNYRVFGKMGDDKNFRGIIIVRKDSGITRPEQLKGKAVSFPAPTALAATMMPQYYLQMNGVNVLNDLDIRYVGSQESSVMNVFVGDTIAGATWPPPWRALVKERPEIGNELKVIWETKNLPNNSLVVREDIPEDLVNKVQEILVNLHKHEEGRAMLSRMELSQFEVANNGTYKPVLDFLADFEKFVRPLH